MFGSEHKGQLKCFTPFSLMATSKLILKHVLQKEQVQPGIVTIYGSQNKTTYLAHAHRMANVYKLANCTSTYPTQWVLKADSYIQHHYSSHLCFQTIHWCLYLWWPPTKYSKSQTKVPQFLVTGFTWGCWLLFHSGSPHLPRMYKMSVALGKKVYETNKVIVTTVTESWNTMSWEAHPVLSALELLGKR